jgi:hypothetical protein
VVALEGTMVLRGEATPADSTVGVIEGDSVGGAPIVGKLGADVAGSIGASCAGNAMAGAAVGVVRTTGPDGSGAWKTTGGSVGGIHGVAVDEGKGSGVFVYCRVAVG